MDSKNFVEVASSYISRQDFSAAVRVLSVGLRTKPSAWQPFQRTCSGLHVSFWSEDEFFSYVSWDPKGTVYWVRPSYSQACYWLAYALTELGDRDEATSALKCGIAMEPDHPELLCELAFLRERNRPEERLTLFREASTSRPWMTNSQRARALRGCGTTLVELKRYDEAQRALLEALELAPGNANAKSELCYVQQGREKNDYGGILPWFLRALRYPPADANTRTLLEMAEGLDPVRGQTL
jgi:hypothetical protein